MRMTWSRIAGQACRMTSPMMRYTFTPPILCSTMTRMWLIHWFSAFSSSVRLPPAGFFFGCKIVTPGAVKP